jgi:hypothetical protein
LKQHERKQEPWQQTGPSAGLVLRESAQSRERGDRDIVIKITEFRLEVWEGDGVTRVMYTLVGHRDTASPISSCCRSFGHERFEFPLTAGLVVPVERSEHVASREERHWPYSPLILCA